MKHHCGLLCHSPGVPARRRLYHGHMIAHANNGRPSPPNGPPDGPDDTAAKSSPRNVLGTTLAPCSTAPMTGFFRDGSCRTCPEDVGSHTVCCEMTEAFLVFSRSRGNDLSTPRPEWGFPGLNPGDRWCVCASRWLEAARAGCAPLVALDATHERALTVVPIDELKAHAAT